MEEHEKIELRSEDMQEILGMPPTWMVRWGTSIIFFGIAMLLTVAWLVKYPDIVTAPVNITTTLPAVPVVARTTGYLAQLRVKDNDSVQAGDLLVVLQNTGRYEDILRLEHQIDSLVIADPLALMNFQPDPTLQIGELQNAYSSSIQLQKTYTFTRNENFASKNEAQYRTQIDNYRQRITEERSKMATAEINLKVTRDRFSTRQKMYSEPNTIISLQELQDARRDLSNAEQEVNNIRAKIKEIEGSILQINKNIIDVQQTSKEGNSNKFVTLVESFNVLRSQIQNWKQKYLLFAPIAGKISFFNNFWAQNQNVKDGDEVMAIVPLQGDSMMGMATLPLVGSGKVREGQRVILKFDSYPFQQFGIVEGRVSSKSQLPKDKKSLVVRVQLPNGLNTSYQKSLRFEQQMQGTAEIITEERRFLERVFDSFISVFRNK